MWQRVSLGLAFDGVDGRLVASEPSVSRHRWSTRHLLRVSDGVIKPGIHRLLMGSLNLGFEVSYGVVKTGIRRLVIWSLNLVCRGL